MKKFIAFWLLGTTLLLPLASCRKIDNPFVTSSDDYAIVPTTGSSLSSGSSLPSSGTLETLEEEEADPFYSMTAMEATMKYDGLDLTKFDGKYEYKTERESYTIRYGTYTEEVRYSVLYRYPYGEPEKKTVVCPDPLCSHRPDNSNCVFKNITSFYCYKGKLFYKTWVEEFGDDGYFNNTELCMYDDEKGKKIVLDQTKESAVLEIHGDGELYYIKKIEKENFEKWEAIYKVGENGTLTKLCEEPRHFGIFPKYIYDDRILIYDSNRDDTGRTFDDLDEDSYYRIGIYNLETGEEHLIHMAYNHFEEIMEKSSSNIVLGLYGSKLLYKVSMYRKHFDEVAGKLRTDSDLYQYYLIDVVTLEETLLTEYDYVTSRFNFELTDRCIFFTNVRKSEEDPMILHILFPQEGKEEVYNLSELIGDNITLETSFFRSQPAAVTLTYQIEIDIFSYVLVYTYEVDLPSGRVRYLGQEF